MAICQITFPVVTDGAISIASMLHTPAFLRHNTPTIKAKGKRRGFLFDIHGKYDCGFLTIPI